MTRRQINLTLKYATAALAVGSFAAAALGLFLPLKTVTTAKDSSPSIAGDSRGTNPTTGPTLASFEPLFNRPLRTALGGAPTNSAIPPDPTPQAVTPPPSLAFVGTVGDSLAMIRSADGSVSVVGIGEQVEGAKLLAIRPTQVDLRSGDGSFTLTKSTESPADASMPGNPQSSPATPGNKDQTNFAHGY